jgi:ribokinase
MEFDVVGFAAINEDRIRHVDRDLAGSEAFSLDPPLELEGDEKAFLGGSVINTLAGLAKMNFNVAAIGLLGNDDTGLRQKERMREHGINFLGEVVDNSSSGVAQISVGRNKEREIIIHPGVNDTFDPHIVGHYSDLIYGCELFHSSTFACAFDRYGSLESQIAFAKMARKASLSFGMLYCDILEKRRPDLIKELLSNTDVLILNEDEALAVAGEGNYRYSASNIMKVYGIGVVAVTLGERGSHVFGKKDYFIEPRKVQVRDLTGAGDAFAAGFLSGYILKKDLRTCGELGNLNAAMCIQVEGAVDYTPTIKKIIFSNFTGPA